MITIQPGNAQHIGNRKDQQDAFGFTDLEDTSSVKHIGCLAIVADGMGGLNFGDLASRWPFMFLREYMKKHGRNAEDALMRSLLAANRQYMKWRVKRTWKMKPAPPLWLLLSTIMHYIGFQWETVDYIFFAMVK